MCVNEDLTCVEHPVLPSSIVSCGNMFVGQRGWLHLHSLLNLKIVKPQKHLTQQINILLYIGTFKPILYVRMYV